MEIVLKPEASKLLLKIPTTGKSIIPATSLIKITAIEDEKYTNELDIEANGYLLTEKNSIDYSVKIKIPARMNNITEKEIVLPEKTKQLFSSLISLQEDIEMTVDENNCLLKARKTKYKIPKMDTDLFIPIETPNEEELIEIKLNGSLLKEIIKKVLHSAGKKNEEFNVVELNILPLELKAVATNSYTLSIAKIKNSHELIKIKEIPTKINIPIESAILIEKIAPSSENIIIKDYKSKIIITDELENIEIHIVKNEKKLPDYNKIIESIEAREDKTQIIVNKKELEDLIKRALVIVENIKKISIKIDKNENKLTISSSESENKFTEDLTSCQIKNPKDIEITINGIFLLNALSQINTQEANITIYDNSFPIVVKGVNEPEDTIQQTELIAPMN